MDNYLFKVLLDVSSIADKTRLQSVSSPHAASWLSATPSEGLGLHLDPSQFQVAMKWLGLEVSYGSCCPLCSEIALDPLGHHTVPGKGVVMWFPTTTNYMMSLQSPVGELIWVSRLEMGSNSHAPITATPI